MKRVLITGAISGIGLAASRLFLERNWQVIMADKNENKQLFEEIQSTNIGNVFFLKCDVSKNDDVKKLYKFCKNETDSIDAIINNAGIITHGLLHETDESDWDKIITNDVKPIFLTSKYFIPDMIAQGGGTIVNTASISGLFGDYKMPVYNAAKGAIVNLTRAMALDYGEFNIRVNSVCPGATDTPMLSESSIPLFAKVNPLKRIASPREVAKAMYFLSSDEASYCNGVNLPVTGGLEAQTGQPKR